MKGMHRTKSGESTFPTHVVAKDNHAITTCEPIHKLEFERTDARVTEQRVSNALD